MRKQIIPMVAVTLLLVPLLAGQTQKRKLGAPSPAQIARGKYLVERVTLCGDCHTPTDEKGEPLKDQWLKGATLTFKPTEPAPGWSDKAPNIAGLPGWKKDAAIRFMMTGIASNGLPGKPPMPQFRFNLQDAEAIVAYLKSLDPAR